jgi:hypothetical protein
MEDAMLTENQMNTIEQFVAEHHDIEVVHVFSAGCYKRNKSLYIYGIIDDGFEDAGKRDYKLLARFEHRQSANVKCTEAQDAVKERIDLAKSYDESMALVYRREDEYWRKVG